MKLENVSFTYSPNTAYEIHALKNVNLDIRDGEFISFSATKMQDYLNVCLIFAPDKFYNRKQKNEEKS